MSANTKATMLTRRSSGKYFGGQPSPLDITEPPTNRQVIQYSYFIKNSCPDIKEYDISKMIADDVVKIWSSVNPSLPLHDTYNVVKSVDRLCFKKAKEINRKCLSKVQVQNMEKKLDKLFDISACTCNLPILPCDDRAVRCNKEKCLAQHIICTCPPSKKVI
jgi:hypothetical protein